jgi:hypothetical protein
MAKSKAAVEWQYAPSPTQRRPAVKSRKETLTHCSKRYPKKKDAPESDSVSKQLDGNHVE